MAQSLSCNFNNTIPFSKPWKLNHNGYDSAKFPTLGFAARPRVGGIKAMAPADRRENLDHLQRSAAKKREGASLPVGLWDRFPTARTVQQMMDTMDRMMEEPLAFTSTWPSTSPATTNGGYARGRTPWEIKEGQAEYKMRFDMPGMTRNDVKVWVEEKMLVIKAEKLPKKKEGQENGGAVVAEEEEDWPAKSFGRYSTRIGLPENVEFEKIKAEVKDGVLYVTIPKASPSSKIFDINVQ
uniref:SHSP domain-containing protein n=1 Tax=Opuntia streptacantha TaxID=393608 RepID=A0A7C9CK96_OPUST